MSASSSSSRDVLLVLNSGSSSLKAGLFVQDPGVNFAGERVLLKAEASGIGQGGGTLALHDANGQKLATREHALGSQEEALEAIVAALKEHQGEAVPCAVGHRVVHGGPRLRQHALITPSVLQTLQSSIHFAPLHLPAALKLIERAEMLFPKTQQIACFDTAFHQTMPSVAKRLPVPAAFAAEGVERYGFHGLSYESIVAQLRSSGDRLPDRIVLAHLGSGSSLCAVRRGKSIDTTMGLTPAGGIPMATRTGDIDPGVLFFFARAGRLSVDALEQLVNHKAGLAAVAEGSGDMQQLEKAMRELPRNNPEQVSAALAFDLFATSIAKAVAALTVSLAGLDLLVFAGGIGEHSAPLRAAVLTKLAPFGLRMDTERNTRGASSIHSQASNVPVRIVAAEEDLIIAAHTRSLLGTR